MSDIKLFCINSGQVDEEAGYEYPCDVGRIDLLAKHKKEGRWLVIELKRGSPPTRQLGSSRVTSGG
jgi:hypothetical protein